MPRVSVLIPAYNHAAYIRQCVDSALSQTYQDVEVIVVDDGSTDSTYSILQGYGSRITLIRQENSGTQAARNAAIRASAGEFLALLDSDDAWLPRKLELQLGAFSTARDAGLLYSQAYRIDACGNILFGGKPFGAPLSGSLSTFEQLLIQNTIPTVTVVIRRECLDQVGVFDTSLLGAGDRDLWLRIAAGWEISYLPEPLALYRMHDRNTTQMLYMTRRAYEERLRVLDKAFSLYAGLVRHPRVREKALAQAHMLGAECEAWAGNPRACGVELVNALSLAPELVEESGFLSGQISAWARAYSRPLHGSWKCFWSGLSFLKALAGAPGHVEKTAKIALARGYMESAFSAKEDNSVSAAKGLLALAIVADPSWLRNRGVLSLVLEAFAGRRIATLLRKSIHHAERFLIDKEQLEVEGQDASLREL